MKLNLIRKYTKLPFNSLKKILKDRKIVSPIYLGKIRKKNTLMNLIRNHNYHQSILYLQSQFRRKIAQNKLADIKSQKINISEKFHNETNLIGDKILKKVPDYYRFKFCDYLFDLRELYKYYQINGKLINSYTNLEFPDKIQKQILRLFWRCQSQKIPLELVNKIPNNMKISSLYSNFYSQLGELDCYTDIERFNNYTLTNLYRFMVILFRQSLTHKILAREWLTLSNELGRSFQRIPIEYYHSYIINNFNKNPYLNYYSESDSINNTILITEEEHSEYINSGKKIIELFLTNCFNVLQKLLSDPEDKRTMGLIINSMINPLEEDDFVDTTVIII